MLAGFSLENNVDPPSFARRCLYVALLRIHASESARYFHEVRTIAHGASAAKRGRPCAHIKNIFSLWWEIRVENCNHLPGGFPTGMRPTHPRTIYLHHCECWWKDAGLLSWLFQGCSASERSLFQNMLMMYLARAFSKTFGDVMLLIRAI